MDIKEPIIKDVLDFNKWMYSLTGFGNIDFPSKFHRLLYITYRTCVQVTFCIHLSIMYYDIYLFYNNLPMLSLSLSIVMFASVGVAKIMIMHFRKNELEAMKKRLDENLNLPWVEENWETDLKKRYSDKLRMMVGFIYVSILGEGILTAALPLIKNGKQKFFLPTSALNYLSKSRFYVPIYVVHVFVMINFLVNFVSNDMTFITLVSRICENLDIIETRLRRFNDSYDFAPLDWTSNYTEKLLPEKNIKIINQREMRQGNNKIVIKKCIIHHQAVLREIKIMIDIYNIPVVLHFTLGPILCAFLLYVVFSRMDQEDIILQQTIFAFLTAIYLLLYCWFGSFILQKFQDIRFAFYSHPWYDMDLETKKLIQVVLLSLEKCGRLKVGKIFDVTLNEYLTIAKNAYNVVTVLRNTN